MANAAGHGGRRPGAGRKRKPAEVARAEGNPGHKTKGELEPVHVMGKPMRCPPAPPTLPRYGVEFWDVYVRALFEQGFADLSDVPALELVAVQWARQQQLRDVIAREGLFALGSTGQITEHPAAAAERSAVSLLRQWMTEFPLTAAARARLGLQALAGGKLAAELDELIGENPRGVPVDGDVIGDVIDAK